jgi:hypothetical protein
MTHFDLTVCVREPIVRYLRSLQPQQLDQIGWRSLAVLLSDDARVWEEFESPLATRVVEGIYALCSPLEACVFLGDLRIARHVESQQFGRLCEAVCGRTQDVLALRALSSGLCLHHDRNPGLPIPATLADLLLSSVDEDARLCGLKVLRRLDPEEEPFTRHCLAALADRSSSVRLGGTYELLCYYRKKTGSLLPQPLAAALKAAVVAARDHDPERAVRENAAHLVDLLEHVGIA